MQIGIVQVAISLARVTKTQPSVQIVGAFSDMMRHLRKCIHCTLDDSELGDEVMRRNRKLYAVIDECLVQLSYKVIYLSSTCLNRYQLRLNSTTHYHSHEDISLIRGHREPKITLLFDGRLEMLGPSWMRWL